jgi:hypothetical protein
MANEPVDDEGVMGRKGYYGAHSRPQQSAGSYGFAMLERASAAVPLGGGPVVVSDMGAAGGRSELQPLALAVGRLRERLGDGPPLLVVHTDLPGNDFSALFELIESSQDSYLRAASGVFPYAAGRSFFGPLLPPATLALGWSAIAVHWLSAVPVPLPGEVYSAFATGDVAVAFARRSAEDWSTFLRCRAAELVPGGELVVVGGSAADDGTSGAEPLMGTAGAVAREMVAEGLLGEAELGDMTVPTWNRTTADFTEPFEDASLPLELVEHEAHVLDDLFAATYAEDGDAVGLADGVTTFLRAFTEASLFGAALGHRPDAERTQLADDFYRRVHDRLVADPAAGRADWHVLAMRIRRR